jgi:hypothetical protein
MLDTGQDDPYDVENDKTQRRINQRLVRVLHPVDTPVSISRDPLAGRDDAGDHQQHAPRP